MLVLLLVLVWQGIHVVVAVAEAKVRAGGRQRAGVGLVAVVVAAHKRWDVREGRCLRTRAASTITDAWSNVGLLVLVVVMMMLLLVVMLLVVMRGSGVLVVRTRSQLGEKFSASRV